MKGLIRFSVTVCPHFGFGFLSFKPEDVENCVRVKLSIAFTGFVDDLLL